MGPVRLYVPGGAADKEHETPEDHPFNLPISSPHFPF